MRDDFFDTAEPILLRMASAPRTGPEPDDGLGAPSDSTSAIQRVFSDPLLREAIQVASGSLADSLDRIDSGGVLGAKRHTSAALSATRYALRMSSRPTPFGLFAGVTTARLGSTAYAEITGPGHKAARLDAGWLHERVQSWLEDPGVRGRVSVVTSDLCYRRGDRLVLSDTRPEVSVRHNALVALVCEDAARPTPYEDVLRQAAAAFPGFPGERIDAVLARLVRLGFLLTSITPHHIDAPLLDRVESAVEGQEGLPGAAGTLREVRSALAAYEKTEPGAGGESWHRLRQLTDPAGAARRPQIQVDLRVDADVTLPHAVAEEARRYASAMWAISPEWATHAHMRAYRSRFKERYGTSGTVPLAELIDPHRGLGFPAEYRDRSGQGAGAVPPAAAPGNGHDEGPFRERRALAAQLVQEALLRDDQELRLTPDLIDRLSPPPPASTAPPVSPPCSMELCFQLLADSVTALDEGDFRLVGSPLNGSRLAGAMAGRFTELLGGTAELSRLMAFSADEDTLLAQVAFSPHTTRTLNLIQVPPLLPYTIPVGVYADRGEPGCLDWRELVVSADVHGMRLSCPRTGQRVVPVVPHMLVLDNEAPEVVRLMVDIVFGRSRNWTGWGWWGLEDLPFRPQVSFGKVIVSPRRWTPDQRLREAAQEQAQDPAGWALAIGQWRERYRVPDRLQVLRWDQSYGVDLTDPWHQSLLRQDIRRTGNLALFDDLTADGQGLGWAQGRSAEVVIPLSGRGAPDPDPDPELAPDPVSATPSSHIRVPATSSYHLPGEDWLFAKMYAVPGTHDELIRTHLPTVLGDLEQHIDRWFFIRYRDPDPHLRIRFHGDPETLRAHALPTLARHLRRLRDTGAIRTAVLDTYEPETDRYGGPEAVTSAEQLFCVDSRSVVAQLAMRARGVLDLPDEVLAAVNQALLLESLGDWNWCAWVDDTFPKGPEHADYQQHRALVRDLVRPGRGRTAARFAEAYGAPALAALWTEAPEPRTYGRIVLSDKGRPPSGSAQENAVLALLHMQYNRLLGIDRAGELSGYAVLRGVARDHLARLAHESVPTSATGTTEGSGSRPRGRR